MPTARNATGIVPTYQRHRPEQTLLYQIIEQHYPDFADHLAAQSRLPPLYVLKITSSVAGLSMVFYEYNVTPAMQNTLLLSVANAAAFAPVVAQGVWQKVRYYW